MAGAIRVGISAWTEKTLVASGWYPPEAHDAEGRLRWYATQFPIVENDSTHYAIPANHQAELWRDRTPKGFTMNVKAFALLTDHYTNARQLPEGLREALSPALRAKARLYPKDVGEDFLDEVAARFRDAVDPLRRSGRLGLVLLQYPVWFPIGDGPRRALVRARERLPDVPLAVEFRNATWMSDRNREATLAFLREHGLAYTCVDEPQGFPSSVPPVAEATADVAVVRLHGRNATTWDAALKAARDRFRYRYMTRELAAWVPKVQHLAQSARDVHVVFNNCYRDYAVRGAIELTSLLEQAGADVVRPPAQRAGRRAA